MFVVIIFPIDNTVAIVPTSWLGDGMVVKWPTCSSTNRVKLCKKGEPYSGETEEMAIEVYGFAKTFKAAVLKELEAVRQSFYTSHDNTIAMLRRPRRAKKRPRKIIDSTSESSNDSSSQSTEERGKKKKIVTTDEEEPYTPIPPAPPSLQVDKQLSKGDLAPILQSTMIVASSQESPSTSAHKPLKSVTLCDQQQVHIARTPMYQPVPHLNDLAYKSLMAFLKNTEEKQEAVNLKIMDLFKNFTRSVNQRLLTIEAKVDLLCMKTNVAITTTSSTLPLPLKTKQEFMDFEDSLKTGPVDDFNSTLAQVRGHTLGHFIRNAMGRILTIELARQMNISGLNGKIGLKGTHLLRFIQTFLNNDSRFVGYEERELNHIIRNWLHNCKYRESLDVRRTTNRPMHNTTVEDVHLTKTTLHQ